MAIICIPIAIPNQNRTLMSVVEVFHVSLALLQTPNGSRIYSNQNLKKVLSLQRFLTASDLLTSDIIWIGLQNAKSRISKMEEGGIP